MLHRRDEQCTDLLCSGCMLCSTGISVKYLYFKYSSSGPRFFSDCIFMLCICFQDGSGGSFTKGTTLKTRWSQSERQRSG